MIKIWRMPTPMRKREDVGMCRRNRVAMAATGIVSIVQWSVSGIVEVS